MAERFAARLPAPHRALTLDRGAILQGQHPPRAPRVERGVCWAGRQGCGQLRLAQTKGDWDAWNARSLAEQLIVRLILDGTVARVRLAKGDLISLLVALGVRADGQKMLLAIKSMGGEGEAAWRALLDDSSGVDCRRRSWSSSTRAGSEKALAALWPDMAAALHRAQASQSPRPCARAPARGNLERLRDMIYAATRGEVETRRKAFIRKWRLKSRVVADSLEEAGDKLFTFTRFPPSQWKSIRTSNAIERLHEEFKRGSASDRAALRRHRRHAVLGAARLRTDHHAQGRRMAHPRRETRRSDH